MNEAALVECAGFSKSEEMLGGEENHSAHQMGLCSYIVLDVTEGRFFLLFVCHGLKLWLWSILKRITLWFAAVMAHRGVIFFFTPKYSEYWKMFYNIKFPHQ